MAWITAFGIYFIVWWVTLFAVLPFGVKTAEEAGEEVISGHAPSAPHRPRLVLKFAITTVVSAVLFAAGWFVVNSGWFTLDSLPFLPELHPIEKS